ncbi:MAG: 50S ribosomal protein L15 [Patescibacteria group bacterium]|nr:50S ribosomal protein L15 [Patescibacteria group bacterium]
MPLALHTIKPAKGSKRNKKRVGRGNASGHGTYSTRGLKGQRSRSGGKGGLKYKGMKQMLLSVPKKRGFKSLKPKPEVLNINDLDAKFNDNAKITPKTLRESGLISKIDKGVKILGKGETEKKFTIIGCDVSKSAREKIEKSGGIIKI